MAKAFALGVLARLGETLPPDDDSRKAAAGIRAAAVAATAATNEQEFHRYMTDMY